MSKAQTLFETRYPYASEAKNIIAVQLTKKYSPVIGEWFARHWEVRLKLDDNYLVIRDTFITPGELKDDWVLAALKESYSANFVKKGDKIEAKVILSKIEAPTGENLIGANGKICCRGGACVGCPNYRA